MFQSVDLEINALTVCFCGCYKTVLLLLLLFFRNVEVLLLGELFIWVPMSPDRVTNISLNDAFKVTFTGKPGEQISFAYSVNSYTHLESFALGPDGTTVLVLNTTSPTTTAPSPVTTTPSPVTTESSANYFSASIVLILLGFFLVTEIM